MTRILPKGKTQFFDANGNPLALGFVYFYIPNTLTPKNTWQDEGQTILNTNPIHLDAAGWAVIWGSGSYRQIVTDSLGNTIWDQIVSSGDGGQSMAWGGQSGGIPNAQTVAISSYAEADGANFEFVAGATNTGPATLTVNSGTPRALLKQTANGPVPLTGSEVILGNIIQVVYVNSLASYVISNAGFVSLSVLPTQTSIGQGDFVPFYNISLAEGDKLTVPNFYKSIGELPGFDATYTIPIAANKTLIWDSAGDMARGLTLEETFRAIASFATVPPDLDHDLVAFYDSSGKVAAKSTLRSLTGVLGYIGFKHTAAGDASIIFTDLDPYRMIQITLIGCLPSVTKRQFQMQLSKDNGATWITTGYLNQAGSSNTASFWLASDSAADQVALGANKSGLNGTCWLFNLSTSQDQALVGNTVWEKASSDVNSFPINGVLQSGAIVNAIKFSWDADNFQRGKIVLNGILESAIT